MRVPCPHCGQKTEFTDNPHRPFCSERCKAIDFGDWAMERNRIPTEETPDSTAPDIEQAANDPDAE